jgi:hypothetical protein
MHFTRGCVAQQLAVPDGCSLPPLSRLACRGILVCFFGVSFPVSGQYEYIIVQGEECEDIYDQAKATESDKE